MIRRIPEPISCGLMLSYKCNARCRHCMYACSPDWQADWISISNLEEIIARLAGKIVPSPLGREGVSLNHGLHFTGGEPFLNFKLLCRAVEIARDLGIPSTFVETNCCWCVTDAKTREWLLLLRDKGLHGILISVNPFYLEYVPFERTQRAVRIGKEIFDRNLMVYQTEYYRRFTRSGIKTCMPFDDYLEIEGIDRFFRDVEFFFMGRAVYSLDGKFGKKVLKYSASLLLSLPCMPPFLRNWHNHVDNYGNYIPGYCGGITLGDCRNLDRLLREGVDTEEQPILGFLIEGDFRSLFEFSQSHGYHELEGGYFSKCHLCIDMRRWLVQIESFKELQPLEFYRQLS